MSKDLLIVLVVGGASVIGLWVDVRFPGALPRRRGLLLVHLVLALVALRAAPVLMGMIPGVETEPAPATVALLGVFMPALAYTVLSAVWIMRAAQGSLFRT
jgi:hypothetical protein